MTLFIQVKKGHVIIQTRAESPDVIGDLNFQVNPGETLELDEYTKTYEELVEQGSGDFKI